MLAMRRAEPDSSFREESIRWGHLCQVIAPTLIPTKPGDRRKNDRLRRPGLRCAGSAPRLGVGGPRAKNKEGCQNEGSTTNERIKILESISPLEPFGLRDRAMIVLPANTGLRVSELAGPAK